MTNQGSNNRRALRDLNGMWRTLIGSFVVSGVALAAGVDVDVLAGIVLILTIPPALAFPILYHRMYNWRRTWIGQSLMIKSIGVAMVLLLAGARRLMGDFPGREYLVYAFFLFIAVGTFTRVPALFKDRQPPVVDDENPAKRSVSEN